MSITTLAVSHSSRALVAATISSRYLISSGGFKNESPRSCEAVASYSLNLADPQPLARPLTSIACRVYRYACLSIHVKSFASRHHVSSHRLFQAMRHFPIT